MSKFTIAAIIETYISRLFTKPKLLAALVNTNGSCQQDQIVTFIKIKNKKKANAMPLQKEVN
jgi:hypothetical protein